MAESCTKPDCACRGEGVIARYRGKCLECWRPVTPGQCISPHAGAASGWIHSECPDKVQGVLVNVEPVIDPGAPNAGDHAPEPLARPQKRLTAEQCKILDFKPEPGQVLRITAVAGAGKTTTCVKLTERLLAGQDGPGTRILYVVFNEKAKEEASARFKKQVLVSTSHSLAKKRVWPSDRVNGSHPNLDFVARRLGLLQLAEAEVEKGKGRKPAAEEGGDAAELERRRRQQEKQVQRLSRRQARFVLKTLDSFLSSDSPCVQERHVFYKAREKKTFELRLYVEKAQQAFDIMCNSEDLEWNQTHDGYLKLFQLGKFNLGPNAPPPKCCNCDMFGRHGRNGFFYSCLTCDRKVNGADARGFDVIIIDEAQDFTPCQADAFFSQARHGATVYLVGDPHQRMYRWRGARDSFEMEDVGHLQFCLTESFRFGPEVAQIANAILSFASGRDAHGSQKVIGRGEAGEVLQPSQPFPGPGVGGCAAPVTVVIARTNKGIFQELIKRLNAAGDCGLSWATVDDKGPSYMFNERAFRPYLQLHRGDPIKLKGEEISTWDELNDFIEEEGDAEMRTLADLVEEHQGNIPNLLSKLGSAKLDWREADVAFITAHKAKGLEFDFAELAADFTMPYDEEGKLLPYESIRKPYFQEELNILYVAVTRAKRWLRLSKEVSKLLADLDATPTQQVHAPQERTEWLEDIRKGDEARWQLFQEALRSNPDFVVEEATVPFPRGPRHNILALPDSLTIEEAQRLVAEALLRWHPDKFLAQLGQRLGSGQQKPDAALRAKLAEVTRELLKMRKSYSLGGEAGRSEPHCLVCLDETVRLLRSFCCKKYVVCNECYIQLRFSDAANLRRCPQCQKNDFRAASPRRHCIRDVARPGRSRSRRRG